MLKYTEFITEKVIYDLLLESKLIYSQKFINILRKMKTNKVAKNLLDLYSKDIDVNNNYIDITDSKDDVTFTPDRKVKELMKDKPETWIVVESGRYLTHGSSNDAIFSRLGYDKTKNENWDAPKDTIGTILSETISTSSGKTYVLFKSEDGRLTVLNKTALEPNDGLGDIIWKTARNPIKVGRLARAILNAAKISFIDRDIEEFSNIYKSTFDMAQNALARFDIVSGDDISYWYDSSKYKDSNNGTLGNSCMSSVNSGFFDIYTNNSKVSLVILYDEDGSFGTDGKYKSNKITGRALLWDTKCVGHGDIKFMDRIYTNNDSDVELFKQFGEKNDFWYKKNQNSDSHFEMKKGSETINNPTLVVDLECSMFDEYPYVDTLRFLNRKKKKVSNKGKEILASYEMNSTEGELYNSYWNFTH